MVVLQQTLMLVRLLAVATPGQITLCYTPDDDEAIQQMFMVAVDNAVAPAVIHQKSVSAD